MKLTEAIQFTPSERERLHLPVGIQRMLPVAQAMKIDEPPVEPRERGWVKRENPSLLERSFLLDGPKRLVAFLSEIIDYENDIGHNGKITIDGMKMNIKVWTHDINEVTQVDINYSRDIDDIFRDVNLYNFEENDSLA